MHEKNYGSFEYTPHPAFKPKIVLFLKEPLSILFYQCPREVSDEFKLSWINKARFTIAVVSSIDSEIFPSRITYVAHINISLHAPTAL
jgi:hypothetical protein